MRTQKYKYYVAHSKPLPSDWRNHLKEYRLLAILHQEELDGCQQEKTEEEFGELKACLEKGGYINKVTGRLRPNTFDFPYKIYHLPSRTVRLLPENEEFDEHLRIVCQMLDMGMKTVDCPPASFQLDIIKCESAHR